MRVLVVNSGSSSLKLSVLDGDRMCGAEELPASGGRVAEAVVASAVHELGPVEAVGHRIVHGGERYRSAVRVTDVVVAALEELAPLAPLHQAASLAALRAVSGARPGAPAVACFDTAFHATLPAAAATYALPRSWRERWPLRRFGFHGLSHAHAARRAAELLERPLDRLRIVSCHLGAGASLAAVRSGRSLDTTMASHRSKLVMATRSGTVDPGLLLWLIEHTDALVFTGGVGEQAPAIRTRAVDGIGFLGVGIDEAANAAALGDHDITATGAAVSTLVITAREDVEIAREVRELLSTGRSPVDP